MLPLVSLKISVLGGDARSVYVAREFVSLGAQVKVLGISVSDRTANMLICRDVAEALTGLDALVVPLPGIDNEGRLHTVSGESLVISRDVLQEMGRKVPIYTVMAGPYLASMATQLGLQVIELVKFREFAIYNSIPSAEGAIQLAMEKLPITIHGCRAMVLGFGNVGMTLARMLGALGAVTTVMARSPATLARVHEMGLGITAPEQLADHLAGVELVFNTVPALILDRKVLESVNPAVCIIDLALAPGGTDFEAARALGLNAGLAPSLPGKVAPKTAGRIIANTVWRLLNGSSLKGTLEHEGAFADATGGH